MNNKKIKIFLEENRLPLSGNLYIKNKRRINLNRFFKFSLLTISFIFIVFISIYAFFLKNKTNAESINQTTILNQLSKNIILPKEEIINIMRISNAKELSSQDKFYENIENGDYILIFKNMSMIYDFDKNLIKNIKTY